VPKISLKISLILLILGLAFAQTTIKYQIPDAGTEYGIGVAVKVNGAGALVACDAADNDVVGVIVAKETSGGNRYYLVSSAGVTTAYFKANATNITAGDKLTTAAGGSLYVAGAGEVYVGIAVEDGPAAGQATLKKVILTINYINSGAYIRDQNLLEQIADFWISGNGHMGSLTVDSAGVINNDGVDADFQVKGDNEDNLIFADASADRVGIGTATPSVRLDIESSAAEDGIDINNTAADGDPRLAFQLSGTSVFTMGIDDGDADKFKIGTTAIGTNTRMTIDSDGIISLDTQSRARAYISADQSIPNNSWTKVEFDAEDFDQQSEFDSATNYRFTATVTGYYQVNCRVEFDYHTAGSRGIAIYVNGAVNSYGSSFMGSAAIGALVNDIVYLTAGQYIEVFVFQDSGGALDLNSGSETSYISIHKSS